MTTTADGGWTVIQKRVDDTEDLNRIWNDYKKGFGDFLIREFWLGLDKIHRLTQNKTENKLRVDLDITEVKTVYAQYEWFGIENERNRYKLHIGSFLAGTVNDSVSTHNGSSFGTWDGLSADDACTSFGGGWWYLKDCATSSNLCATSSNLNGIYPSHKSTVRDIDQIYWGRLNLGNAEAEHQAPKRTEMKIRQRTFHRG
ncbi:Ficolin-1 [Stylophora pistillata]|uniref:Ficolin-1 n=1 Tax=Stylophora pistillata TaxID=50429 RepID=A0A2B4R7E2_STYPI|nr:Ficolin-1 [Stylophora pistillata]